MVASKIEFLKTIGVHTTNSSQGKTSSQRIINVTHLIPHSPILQKQPNTNDTYTWILRPRDAHTALYSGIRSLSKDWDNLMIGYVGDINQDENGYVNGYSSSLANSNGNPLEHGALTDERKKELEYLLAKDKVYPIFLDETEHRGHYEGYCKIVLWPLFHYILWDKATDGREEAKNWIQYVKVNEKFADKIVEIYKPGDIVWIHDYHLLMVPELLRKRLPDATIGLFIHAPFPSSEIFKCLPKRKEVLNGMLGANLIGFQTYSYARHFTSNCTRILGYESTSNGGVSAQGLVVAVGTFPIGIDTQRVESRRKLPGVQSKMAVIKEMYAGKKIIVGRDKLDLVKGVLQKLHAFEQFLKDFPEWRNKVVLIQVTSPALSESPKLEVKVSELIARINGTYGSLEFTPVHHYHNDIDQDEYYSLLSVADIGLITSVRDGMNTTSLEYIVCQKDNHGPLILSEFTGTAGSLCAAMMVNPWDYKGVARAIYDALNLSREEKRIKHMLLYDLVSSYTAEFWAQSFVKELLATSHSTERSSPTPYLNADLLSDKYNSSNKRLLLFDYDGTLTPIVRIPSAALPPPHMLTALEKLTSNPKNDVWIISGRDQKALEEWLGHVPRLGLSAEHGSFLKHPETNKWINLTEDMDMSWMTDVNEIFTYYTERTQGSSIENKRCSVTWHYRNADPDYGAFQAKELQNHLEGVILTKFPVEILLGKKNLEVRPTQVNKGEIVKRLISNTPGVDFIFCAGDDRTDEDMFRAVRKSDVSEESSFCVTIGTENKKTMAQWHVGSPEEVIKTMQKLLGTE